MRNRSNLFMSTIGGVGSWQPPQPYTPPSFTQLDTNSDGGISLDEFEAGAPKAASGSGTAQSAAQQQRAEALFSKIDTNGDGSVSSAELSTFQSQSTQQQSSQQFLTQLIASGQSGAGGGPDGAGGTGAAGGAHHGGHHHGGGGGGVAQIGESTSTDGTTSAGGTTSTNSTTSADGTISADGTTGTDDDALTTLEGILDGTPGDTTTTTADSSSSPLDLLTAANSAYTSSANASTLWSSLSSVLQEAA
jgi:hypothetical protein